ncbi:MAG: bifunctional homocysteine S-methyltransferase/methylenetetrahydrofolate reductase [Chloroflexi bacterium]|nr:bifunctional homocysteine S-methyltransferase/methylenetetrahydrofolate reductase [Chloroflexota bacterium]
MPQSFLERLQDGPILCDGAMGTQLYSRGGIAFDRCFDELNLSQPDLVKAIHLDYIQSGAEIIQTNTFGANGIRLSNHGLEDKVEAINQAGVAIAREARRLTGGRVWIAGSVGSLDKGLAPLGSVSPGQARKVLQEQISTLANGVDLIILETFSDLREIKEAIIAVRQVCDLPIITQMTYTEEGKTSYGHSPEEIVETLEPLGIQVIGANCSVGPQPMLQVMEALAKVSQIPLSAQPNAGFPSLVGGRFFYLSSPEYMAQHARKMVEVGVAIIGGCCGTTPSHIKAMSHAIKGLRASQRHRLFSAAHVPKAQERIIPEASSDEPTGLSQKLGRKFVVTVEVAPPRSFDVTKPLATLANLIRQGLVDTINVADSPRAQGRMSALVLCTLIQSRLGAETILHMATRHRNLVALHSDLLGAHALGVRNILSLMGDLPHTGDYPNATVVSDVSASGLIKLTKDWNHGIDSTGKILEQRTSFFVGCALNMGAKDLDRELKVLERKLKAGADFIITQPVFDSEKVFNCRRLLGGFPIPVIMGVLPLRSYRHAEFLTNEVPGISIPESVLKQIQDAGDDGASVGTSLAAQLLRETRDIVSGAYFIPSFEHYEVVSQVLAEAGNRT